MLERRERLGGACTLERPFADARYVVSPCAYVVGLLDQLVIDELALARRGLEVYVADPNLWAPLPDGTSFAQWNDDVRTQADLDALGVSAADQKGYWAYEQIFDTMRQLLRTNGRDAWIGDSPTRAELEDMLGGDREMIDILFDASIADVLESYVSDRRLVDALFGQGVIGAYAGPRDWGTASVKLMHYQGDLAGQGPVWGYVKGGMGVISFTIAEAAVEAGAELACGTEVAEIVPGEGVRLAGGDFLRARVVLSNADPKRVLAMLGDGDAVPDGYRRRLTDWQVRSPVVKFNAALHRLPTFPAAGGATWPYQSMISVTQGLDAAQRAFEDCVAGRAAVGYGEVYFQTGFDPTPAPEGKHLMSVFGQYAPYAFADGSSWDAQPRRHRAPVRRADRCVRARHRGLHRGVRGARPARHRGAHRAHRRAHLPGRDDARPDVGAPPHRSHADPRPLPLRRRHPSRRQRHRPQRPQRRDGRARGRRGVGPAHIVTKCPARSGHLVTVHRHAVIARASRSRASTHSGRSRTSAYVNVITRSPRRTSAVRRSSSCWR